MFFAYEVPHMAICRIINLQSDKDWTKAGQWLEERAHPGGGDVEGQVREIIANVKSRGDAALIDYTARFDCPGFAGPIRVKPQDIAREHQGAFGMLRMETIRSGAQPRQSVKFSTPSTASCGSGVLSIRFTSCALKVVSHTT